MKRSSITTRFCRTAVAAGIGALAGAALAATPLADQPVFSSVAVPGNLALALSVEFPTAVSVAHQGKFIPGNNYLGYFDPEKCYMYYVGTETGTDLSHFYPVGTAVARKCTVADDTWSGNFLNWLTMQAVDPFRWALTGGYRVVDTPTTTILERAWATDNSQNGGDTNFPLIPTSDGDPKKERPSPTATEIAEHTPLSFSSLKVSVRKRGNRVLFTSTAGLDSNTSTTPTHYSQSIAAPDAATIYSFYARVKVCESGVGYSREANCKPYASGFKPEGLLQEYADRIRFSAFGYLNDPTDDIRDGGVLRARQKFVGPQVINPGSASTSNPASEWDASTGVFAINPDATDAANTASVFGVLPAEVPNSGVINYLNMFGKAQKSYKRRDPVSELYYAALRYLKNQGNVPAWTNFASDSNKVRLIDGFPVITDWDDPIQYSCQKNFILGIGDTNTNWDRNLPGSSGGSNEPSMPSEVSGDSTVNAVTATNKVGSLHGLGGSLGTTGISSGSYLIAGLAYDANTKDIRPDDVSVPKTKGKQTVQTYWLDVLEFGNYVSNNQFYLATKYGGFNAPDVFNPYTQSTDIAESLWYTNSDLVGSQKRPDTYYTVARPDQMVAGLTKAFASIASKLKATTTSFSTSLPQIATAGTASFATQFDAKSWSGEMVASELTVTAGVPQLTENWRFSNKLDAQGAGTGWDTTRVIASYNTATGAGVPFRSASLSSAQVTALDTAFVTGDDSANVLNYLRGERTHEKSSADSLSTKAYRDRTTLLGDIVGSKARPVGPPSSPYSSAANDGYAAFKSTYATRKTMVYVGTNAGMLHAVDGSLTGTNAGKELFAYVPGALYAGPSGTPQTNGLAALSNPTFTHYNFVDATPVSADLDFGKTVGGSGSNWRTILVGGLGKGGRSLYALDITDPASMVTGATPAAKEATLASKVLWEFTDADLGFTYGEPAIVKTRKYGWVVIFGSGHNNADGQGYFFIVNPRTGALLEKIGTGVGSVGDPAGMAHVQAFLLDRTDGTADSVYAGDLHGNLWRLDVTATSGSYPAPLKLAELADGSGVRLAVTTRPLIIAQPGTNRRYVTVGTGRLLHPSDTGSTQAQRFFAIIDGTGARFNPAATPPAGFTYPIQRTNLKQLTDLTQEITLNLNSEIGWFVDLGQAAGSLGWRVISDSTSFNGVVAFAAMVPASDSACEPTGSSRVYAIDLGSGVSRLVGSVPPGSPAGTAPPVVAYNDSLLGVVTDARFFGDGKVGGKRFLMTGSDTGGVSVPPGAFVTPVGVRRLNWREVPLTD